jgi:hypothetical protein
MLLVDEAPIHARPRRPRTSNGTWPRAALRCPGRKRESLRGTTMRSSRCKRSARFIPKPSYMCVQRCTPDTPWLRARGRADPGVYASGMLPSTLDWQGRHNIDGRSRLSTERQRDDDAKAPYGEGRLPWLHSPESWIVPPDAATARLGGPSLVLRAGHIPSPPNGRRSVWPQYP